MRSIQIPQVTVSHSSTESVIGLIYFAEFGSNHKPTPYDYVAFRAATPDSGVPNLDHLAYFPHGTYQIPRLERQGLNAVYYVGRYMPCVHSIWLE